MTWLSKKQVYVKPNSGHFKSGHIWQMWKMWIKTKLTTEFSANVLLQFWYSIVCHIPDNFFKSTRCPLLYGHRVSLICWRIISRILYSGLLIISDVSYPWKSSIELCDMHLPAYEKSAHTVLSDSSCSLHNDPYKCRSHVKIRSTFLYILSRLSLTHQSGASHDWFSRRSPLILNTLFLVAISTSVF